MKALAVAAGCVLLLGRPAASEADIPAEAYARVNAGLLEHHILPRYERMAAAAGELAGTVERFCAGSGDTGLADLRKRFHNAMDAWMGVQHLNFGPVELFMRSYRLYFWPEARGKIAGAVEDMLGRGDTEPLTPERLADASVAAQGLPALEYLLYSEDGIAAGSARCALSKAITANMRNMAEGIVADWRGGSVDYETIFLQPGEDNAYYETHADATLELFKSFHGGLRRIADIKLKPVVGDTMESARPGLAESRASGRALRNIVINLEALQTLYLGEGGPGLSDLVLEHGRDHELDPLMRKAFRMTLATATDIHGPLSEAVKDEAKRANPEKLTTRVLALKQIVRSRVAEALGLAVGFNALDGD